MTIASTSTSATEVPRLRKGCIGLPSTSFPPLGLEGVAVWPVSPATGRMKHAVGTVRRHLIWRAALNNLPVVEHLVLCDPPKWATRNAQSLATRVTVVADAKSALHTLAAA